MRVTYSIKGIFTSDIASCPERGALLAGFPRCYARKLGRRGLFKFFKWSLGSGLLQGVSQSISGAVVVHSSDIDQHGSCSCPAGRPAQPLSWSLMMGVMGWRKFAEFAGVGSHWYSSLFIMW